MLFLIFFFVFCYSGADQLLPCICYVTCASQIPNLLSEFHFIEEFLDEQQISGMDGYILTQLQVAIRFFQESKVNINDISSSSSSSLIKSIVQQHGSSFLHTARPVVNDDATTQTDDHLLHQPRLPQSQPLSLHLQPTTTSHTTTSVGSSPPTPRARTIIPSPIVGDRGAVRQLAEIFEDIVQERGGGENQ